MIEGYRLVVCLGLGLDHATRDNLLSALRYLSDHVFQTFLSPCRLSLATHLRLTIVAGARVWRALVFYDSTSR